MEEDSIELIIKTINNQSYMLKISKMASVIALKQMLKDSTAILEDRQRLIYRGRVLQDDSCLNDYQIGHGHILHMIARPENFRELQEQASQSTTAQNEQTRSSSLLNIANQILQQQNSQSPLSMTTTQGSIIPTNDNSLEHVRQGFLTIHTLLSTINSYEQIPFFDSNEQFPIHDTNDDENDFHEYQEHVQDSKENKKYLSEEDYDFRCDSNYNSDKTNYNDLNQIRHRNNNMQSAGNNNYANIKSSHLKRGNRDDNSNNFESTSNRKLGSSLSPNRYRLYNNSSNMSLKRKNNSPNSNSLSTMKSGGSEVDCKKRIYKKFFIGQWLDVKDTVAQWLEATVMDINYDENILFIHYNGWPVRWDEWLSLDSSRLAPFRSRTVHSANSSFSSPSPVSSVLNAPKTGCDDLRSLLPEIALMLRRLQPLADTAAELSCQDMMASKRRNRTKRKKGPSPAARSDVRGASPWVKYCDFLDDNGGEEAEDKEAHADQSRSIDDSDDTTSENKSFRDECDFDEAKDEAYRRWQSSEDEAINARFREVAAEMCPLLDRLGRVFTDIAPALCSIPASCPSAQPPSRRPASAPAPGSLDLSLSSLLRPREPSPPPERAFRMPVTAARQSQPATSFIRSGAQEGGGAGPLGTSQPGFLDIHIAILSPPRRPTMDTILSQAVASLQAQSLSLAHQQARLENLRVQQQQLQQQQLQQQQLREQMLEQQQRLQRSPLRSSHPFAGFPPPPSQQLEEEDDEASLSDLCALTDDCESCALVSEESSPHLRSDATVETADATERLQETSPKKRVQQSFVYSSSSDDGDADGEPPTPSAAIDASDTTNRHSRFSDPSLPDVDKSPPNDSPSPQTSLLQRIRSSFSFSDQRTTGGASSSTSSSSGGGKQKQR